MEAIVCKPICEILQSIMDEKQLTVAETSKLCGLPDSTVRGIITRKQKSVALEVAFKLSRGLNVSLEELNGETKKSPDLVEPESEADFKERVQLLTAFFERSGYITQGGDLTHEQFKVCKAFVDFLDSYFRQS